MVYFEVGASLDLLIYTNRRIDAGASTRRLYERYINYTGHITLGRWSNYE